MGNLPEKGRVHDSGALPAPLLLRWYPGKELLLILVLALHELLLSYIEVGAGSQVKFHLIQIICTGRGRGEGGVLCLSGAGGATGRRHANSLDKAQLGVGGVDA